MIDTSDKSLLDKALRKIELKQATIDFLEHKLELCRLEIESRDKEIRNVIKQNDIILQHERDVKVLIDQFRDIMNIFAGRMSELKK